MGKGQYYKAQEARDWEEEAGYAIKSQYKGDVLTSPVGVTIHFYFKRDRDIDGGIKILLDIMQDKIYKNDRQVHTVLVRKEFSNNPRVEVAVQEI